MRALCSVQGCRGSNHARGLCDRHYQAARKRGELPPRPERPTLEQRFWEKVEKLPHGCWQWLGGSHKGYGVWKPAGVADSPRVFTHRFAYELLVGPIPDGLQLDHLCRNRACCNPAHLEPVTGRENLHRSPITQAALNAAKTQCVNGHPYDEVNTYITTRRGRPERSCRACGAERMRARRAAAARNGRAKRNPRVMVKAS